MISYAMIEPTNKCNLSCMYCNRKDVVDKQKDLSIEEYSSIVEKLKNYPIKDIKLQGLGEVFFNPLFYQLCELTKQNFPESFLITATNCQHSHFDNVNKALPHINMMYLSVDGYKDNYEKYRPGAKWSTLITFLQEIKNGEYSKTCHINFVANEGNTEDIEKMLELTNEYNLGELRINVAQNWNEDEQMIFDNEELFVEKLIPYKQYIKGKADWKFSDCFWPSRGIYIDVFGNIRMCCLNTSGKSFGNIFTDSISNVKDTVEYRTVVDTLVNNLPSTYCKTCSYNNTILNKLLA